MGKFITFCSLFLIISSLLILFISVYPFEIFNIKSPLRVVSKEVQQGDCVFVEMDYKKVTGGTAIVTVQVITKDDVSVANQILGLDLAIGEHKKIVGFMLPRNVNLRSDTNFITAHLKLTSRYQVWGFRNVDIEYETEEFKIILRKD